MSRPKGSRNHVTPIRDLRGEHRRFVTAVLLADYWGRHVCTVRQWIKSGALPAKRVGHIYHVRTMDALRFESSIPESIR